MRGRAALTAADRRRRFAAWRNRIRKWSITCSETTGSFPTTESLPLLYYPGAVSLSDSPSDPAARFEALFERNEWPGAWRNGIYHYHHYHSTAHETLGIYRGSAVVRLGGEVNGIVVELHAGDVVVIPAGVAHKRLSATPDLGVVGAYPPEQKVDMNYGQAGERPGTDRNIEALPLPSTDPVTGVSGPLVRLWRAV